MQHSLEMCKLTKKDFELLIQFEFEVPFEIEVISL